MKLLINTASTFKGGGVQVANSFINECKKYPEHKYHVVLGQTLGKMIDKASFPENFTFYNIDFRPATRVFSTKSAETFFKKIEGRVNPDAVFTTSGPAYWRPKAPHLAGYNLPHYIYPDSPFFDSLPFRKKLKWKLKGLTIKYFFTRDADAYVVQTDDVRARLKKWIGSDKVYTVSNTCSAYYYNPEKFPDRLPQRQGGEFRFLILSAWYTHKNLGILPAVIDALPDDIKARVKFVVTLPDEVYRENFSEQYRNNVVNAGPVPVEQGPSLYAECDALFLPTLLECFSASYAEAMAMEKPIITSDMGFAHTICADAALYFNPVNANDIASAVVKLVTSPQLQQELIEKGKARLTTFGTAGSRAKNYLKLLEDLVNGRKN